MGQWEGMLRFLHQFRWRWPLLGPILLADVAGILWGWGYYVQAGQMLPVDPLCSGGTTHCQPAWSWPLVADSPNAVLLFFIATLLYRLTGRRSRFLDAFAFALNIYVGLWTTLLFLSYPNVMRTFDVGSVNNILFVTHMGMPLQSLTLILLMRTDRWRWPEAALVLAGLAAFVWVDYWGPHLHPAPHLHDPRVADQVVGLSGDQWLAVASPWLMVVAAAAWLLVARPWRRVAPAGKASA